MEGRYPRVWRRLLRRRAKVRGCLVQLGTEGLVRELEGAGSPSFVPALRQPKRSQGAARGVPCNIRPREGQLRDARSLRRARRACTHRVPVRGMVQRPWDSGPITPPLEACPGGETLGAGKPRTVTRPVMMIAAAPMQRIGSSELTMTGAALSTAASPPSAPLKQPLSLNPAGWGGGAARLREIRGDSGPAADA